MKNWFMSSILVFLFMICLKEYILLMAIFIRMFSRLRQCIHRFRFYILYSLEKRYWRKLHKNIQIILIKGRRAIYLMFFLWSVRNILHFCHCIEIWRKKHQSSQSIKNKMRIKNKYSYQRMRLYNWIKNNFWWVWHKLSHHNSFSSSIETDLIISCVSAWKNTKPISPSNHKYTLVWNKNNSVNCYLSWLSVSYVKLFLPLSEREEMEF